MEKSAAERFDPNKRFAGAILASVLGVMHFEKVAAAPWGAIVIPFRFGPNITRPAPPSTTSGTAHRPA